MTLQMEQVTKQYGRKKALDSFSAELHNGVYGLLGPNGAGKTTLISIIVGILQASAGSVTCDGTDIRKMGLRYIEKIGYLPQYPRFYKNFRAREFLLYMCAVKGIDSKASAARADEMLQMVNLWDDREKKIGAYSGGMRQRLGIAQAMLGDPALLVLDEPTAGLDPKERIRFRNILSRLSAERIVLLATHIVSDVEYIANQVILIQSGHMLCMEKPAALTKSIHGKVFSVTIGEDELPRYLEQYRVSNAAHGEGGYTLRVISQTPPAEDAAPVDPNLEDVYLYHFGEGAL